MPVAIKSTGGGSVTLTAPSTASDLTLTLPSATGTVATTAGTLTNPTINGFTGDTSVINVGSGQIYKDTSGNVGIGTSSPGYKLDVVTTGVRFQSGTSQTSVYVGPQTNSGYIYGQSNEFGFYSDTTSAQLSISKVAAGQYILLNGGAGASAYIGFNANSAERARIDASGSLLVGCTSIPSAGGGGAAIAASGYLTTSRTTTANAAQIQFFNPNGNIGSITTSGSATAYNTSSDYRLKNSVAPMTTGLATVSALKPVTYKWNADDSDGEGFIAHELQSVIPHAVTGEKDAVDADGKPIHQGVDYSKIVVHLVAAIQEQQAQITELKAEIATLKGAA
jgi:hypothetical protein